MKYHVLAMTFCLLPLAVVSTHGAPTGCGDESTAGAGGLYVHDGEVWQESNGKPGLQRGPCIDENGRDQPGDTKLAGPPALPPPPSAPSPYGCHNPAFGAVIACIPQGMPPNVCIHTTVPSQHICLF